MEAEKAMALEERIQEMLTELESLWTYLSGEVYEDDKTTSVIVARLFQKVARCRGVVRDISTEVRKLG